MVVNALIWRNLSAHPLRSALTALAVALGVGMVLAATIVGQAASRSASELSVKEPWVEQKAPGRDDESFEPTSLDTLRAEASGSAGFDVLLVQGGLAMVGLIILFAASFVIANAFAMSVTARTREIGALRALGMMRRQVMRQVLAEAGLLGLIGAALGVLGGVGLAWGLMAALGTLDDAPLDVPGWGVALSITLGLTITLAGALGPAWRASHVSPMVAVRRQTTTQAGWYVHYGGRVGGILALILLPGVMGLAFGLRPSFFLSMALAGAGQAGLLLATVFLMPSLVAPTVRLARPVLSRGLGAAGCLAADNLARNKLRSVLTAGALTAALTTIIATSGLMTAFFQGGLMGFGRLYNEDILIAPNIAALLASGELRIENSYDRLTVDAVMEPALVEAIETLAQAGVVKEVERIGFARVPGALSPLPGAPGVFVDAEIYLSLNNFDFFQGDAAAALEWMRRGRAVLLTPIVAERLGVGVGDAVTAQTPHGEVAFTVAGIGGNGYNFTVFSYADGETYFDVMGPSWLGITIPAGSDLETIHRQVQAAIEPFEGVGAARTDTVFYKGLFDMLDRLQLLLDGLLLLAVLVAALGVVNTMVINVTERRREIALFRAVGATRQQARRMVVAEAATLGLMAALIAAVLSLAMVALFMIVFAQGGAESMGLRMDRELVAMIVPPALRDLALASALALAAAPTIAALAALIPARQAAALEVVTATRSERVTLKRLHRRNKRRDKSHP